jgi:hypothetical protein
MARTVVWRNPKPLIRKTNGTADTRRLSAVYVVLNPACTQEFRLLSGAISTAA